VIDHAEAILDHRLQVDPAPAHEARLLSIRTRLDDRRQLGLLRRPQLRRRTRRLAVEQARGTLAIEAVHPVAQGLPVHPADLRRLAPAPALGHRRQRQQTPALARVPTLPRQGAQILRSEVLSKRYRC
jgi:hypothetical protein